MDYKSKLWDVETGQEYTTLKGHSAEVVSLNFCAEGDKLISGSFDSTGKIWDIRTGQCVYTQDEHTAEISNALFDFTGDYVATCSLDRYFQKFV